MSEELIRVAILWHEMWHEGLEEASRLYFGERNVKGMFAVLEPLHAMMERGPQTLKETSFNQVCVFSIWSCAALEMCVWVQMFACVHRCLQMWTLKPTHVHLDAFYGFACQSIFFSFFK